LTQNNAIEESQSIKDLKSFSLPFLSFVWTWFGIFTKAASQARIKLQLANNMKNSQYKPFQVSPHKSLSLSLSLHARHIVKPQKLLQLFPTCIVFHSISFSPFLFSIWWSLSSYCPFIFLCHYFLSLIIWFFLLYFFHLFVCVYLFLLHPSLMFCALFISLLLSLSFFYISILNPEHLQHFFSLTTLILISISPFSVFYTFYPFLSFSFCFLLSLIFLYFFSSFLSILFLACLYFSILNIFHFGLIFF